MSWSQLIPVRLPPLDFRPIGQVEQEIVDELEFHIEMRTLDNLRAGMSSEAARHDAVRRFGDFERIRQACRKTLLGERIMLQRIQAILTLVLLVAVVLLAVQFYRGQQRMMAALENLVGPTVVQTVPASGDMNVDPELKDIRVTYNRPMLDESWSWCHDPDLLKPSGKPHYEADGKTCVLAVNLEPGKDYAISLNTDQFRNFKDATGRSAVPYLLKFRTRGVPAAKDAEADRLKTEP